MTDKFTVYLVDDDPGVLKALSRLLRARGYEVKAYSSPRVFLEEHDVAVPGCAVLDVSMPGLAWFGDSARADSSQRLSSSGRVRHRQRRHPHQRARHESRRDRFPDQARKGQGFVRSRIPRGSQGRRVASASFRDEIDTGEGQQPDAARTRSVYRMSWRDGSTSRLPEIWARSKRPSRSTAAG